MISWIKGELISSWLNNQKSYVLINCHGLGYEIQTTSYIKEKPAKEIILWLHYIKRDDSDSFYGFLKKDERDFFRNLLNVKGIGPQIGMSILSKFSLIEVTNALQNDDRKLINSVSGVGQKMTERIFLELRSKINPKKVQIKDKGSDIPNENYKSNILLDDISIALKSLDYPKREIQHTIDLILKELKNKNKLISDMEFEDLFKKSLKILEKK